MRMEPCRGCGDLRPVGRKSLSPPTCQRCRRKQPEPKREPKPPGYIAPSRRGECSQCGKVVQTTRTSAPPDRRRCRECQRAAPRTVLKPPWIPHLVTCPCGVVFEQHTWGQKYCRIEHRPSYGSGSSRPHLASAAARGYDYEHVKLGRAARAALVPGTPCPRCGEPMTPDQALDLDHTDDRQGYLGLSHASCNRSHGATLGNRMRARPWWQRTIRQPALFPASKVKPPKARPVRLPLGKCSWPGCDADRFVPTTDRCSQHLHRTTRVPKISKPCAICGVEFTTTARSLAKTCGALDCKRRQAGSHMAECKHDGCSQGANRAGRLCARHYRESRPWYQAAS